MAVPWSDEEGRLSWGVSQDSLEKENQEKQELMLQS